MEALGSTRAIEVTRLAMNGLIDRQQAIAANTANVMTPGYQRKEVAFEDQLQNIIREDDSRQQIKQLNSAALSFNATSLDQIKKPTEKDLSRLNQNLYQAYEPEVIRDFSKYNPETDNNVDIEKEMMDMSKTGTQFGILSTLEGRMLNNIASVIKGNNG